MLVKFFIHWIRLGEIFVGRSRCSLDMSIGWYSWRENREMLLRREKLVRESLKIPHWSFSSGYILLPYPPQGNMRPVLCGNFEYDAIEGDLERLFRKYGMARLRGWI